MIMKKKVKKIIAVMFSTIMVLSMGMISVNASDVQPLRAPLCPGCGRAMVPVKTYGPWVTEGEKKCVHFAFGTDKILSRKVYTTIKCTKCGTAYPTTESKETRTECHGYD